MNKKKVNSHSQKKNSLRGAKRWLSVSIHKRSGFGLNEVIGIAAGIIIAVVVVIPGLREFAENLILNLTNWWNDMAAELFTAT